MSKKVVAICGSQRKNGNSNYIVDKLLEAIPGEDVIVEKFYLGERNIKHCTGCLACRSNVDCVQEDDMKEILDAVMAADKVVISIPIFMFQAAGTIKQFLDRCFPLLLGQSGKYTKRMEPKDTVVVYSQGAPVEAAFQGYIELNQKSLGLLGFNVVETLICTCGNPIGSAVNNTELCARAAEVGSKL